MAKYKVLSTKKLDAPLVDQAIKENIEIIEQEFITIKHNTDKDKFNEIFRWMHADTEYGDAVFTSANAVLPFEKLISGDDRYNHIQWKIFCLSGKTKTALENLSGLKGDIVDTAINASALAQKIIDRGVRKIIFFCGNKRRDELPEILKNAGIEVQELTVYETIETAIKNKNAIDGILFFSPSAVTSFFSKNKIKSNVVCFAIGQTTADSIAACTKNQIIISEKPEQEMMLDDVKLYFENMDCSTEH